MEDEKHNGGYLGERTVHEQWQVGRSERLLINLSDTPFRPHIVSGELLNSEEAETMLNELADAARLIMEEYKILESELEEARARIEELENQITPNPEKNLETNL